MRGAKVLVVDDERAIVEVVARALRERGHAVSGAGTAAEAAAALAGGSFDLVLLDVILPDTTGLQALALLRGLTRAPIHVMSGQSAEEVAEDARLLGAAGFLPKPVDMRVLADLVDALPERR